MNITLIGMPGSGKSFIGSKLANKLGHDFVESDALIVQEYQKPVADVLNLLGDEAFIAKESEIIIRTTMGREGLVISPGGSVIYSEDAMQYLRSISHVCYLNVPLQVIQERIHDSPRGIVRLGDKSFEELFQERTVLYKKWAEFEFSANKDADQLVRDIIARVA